MLVNPAYPVSKSTIRDVTAAAPAMAFRVRVFEASTGGEIDAAFVTLVREKYDALFVGGDPFYTSVRAQLVDLTSQHAIPATFATREFRSGWRPDELWRQDSRRLASGWRLCG